MPARVSGGREDDNVVDVHLLVVDLDHTTDARLDEVTEELTARGLAFMAHTTWSDGKKGERAARFILPLAEAVPAAAWRRERAALIQTLGLGDVDPKTVNEARIYFLPVHREGRDCEVWGSEEGAWLPRPTNLPAPMPSAPLVTTSTFDSSKVRASGSDSLKQFLDGTHPPFKDGEIQDGIHKLMSAAGAHRIPEAVVEDLLQRLVDKLECSKPGEANSHNARHMREGMYSYRRSVEWRAAKDAETEALRLRKAAAIVPQGDEDAWKSQLSAKHDKEGNITGLKPETKNIALILDNDPLFKGHLRWNLMDMDLEVRGGLLAKHSRNTMAIELSYWLQGSPYFLNMPKAFCEDAILACAERNSYDPQQEYFDNLPAWDGVPRIDSMLEDYCGAESTPFTRMVSRKFMAGAAARALQHGIKFDTALVLQGDQGLGKSSFVSALGAGMTASTKIDIGNKDSLMMLTRHWLVELEEMSSLHGKEAEKVRGFISETVDAFRPPYGRAIQKFPRRCVFIGTTNSDQPLTDREGNRRYWVIPVRKINVRALEVDRDQLWAEARAIFEAGEQLWLNQEEAAVAASETAMFEQEEPLDGMLLHWFLGKTKPRPRYVTTHELMERVLMLMPEGRTSGQARRLAQSLRRLGFLSRRNNGARLWKAPQHLIDGELFKINDESELE